MKPLSHNPNIENIGRNASGIPLMPLNALHHRCSTTARQAPSTYRSGAEIKICGLTSVEEAAYLNKNKVNFAGFVLFFPKSKRNITIDTAKEIIGYLEPSISPVAVVVSPTIEEIKQIQQAGFSYIQIHGQVEDEVYEIIDIPVLKAFNVSDMDKYQIYAANPKIKGFVFDAAEPGSGQVFDWNTISSIPRDDRLFILAGGLNADNVQRAIAAIHPDVVDVSSGVEFTDKDIKGKDPKRVDEFCQAVRG